MGCLNISQKYWLDSLFGFIFDTDLALVDIIDDVSIHSRPVDVSLGQVSHLFNASMVVM